MSEELYSGPYVHLGRFVGPAGDHPDRRRYQLTLMRARQRPDEAPFAAWTVLTREDLRELVDALGLAERAEPE